MAQEVLPEIRPELSAPEIFLNSLYDKILGWLESGGQVYAKFDLQTVKNWDHHSDDPGPGISLSLELQKAVIVRDGKKDFALVLGRGKRNKWDDTHLRLQFGFFPKSANRINLSIQELRDFANQEFSHGHGEFDIDPRINSIRVHCWADSGVYGGKDIQRRWKQEQLLSEEGLEECLGVVKRTVRQAFDNDLT